MHKSLSKLFVSMWLVGSPLAPLAQTHIDPPGWWGDLEGGRVEVLISSPTLENVTEVVASGSEVVVESWRPVALAGHVWATLDASAVTEARDVTISVTPAKGRAVKVGWHVEPHLEESKRLDRWGEAPVMYLIMPDRFANGDVGNDDVKGMLERGTDRTEMYKRHGGDLAGVTSKLDYLAELGVGAVWMTPVVENDLARTSYHGYACTDSYKVDPRLGSLEDYKTLAREAHARGIRVVHDWVPNHWGNLHRLLTHPVDSAWVHNWSGGWDESKRTNYRSGTVV
ncbi:MAG: alpha-amylase family glycosyl hydrolase, partial [Flavobacteriales bacterium]|nr:alpha-amylase family glycosyl hydrolase [Flavobacteriales bacterium]